MKKIEKNPPRKNPYIRAAKVLLIILTVIFSLGMVILSGAGLIYNQESYNDSISHIGPLLIVSGLLLAAGALLVCIGKNILSLILSIPGFGLCMFMLRQLMDHADSAGWQNAQNPFDPVSDMYFERIIPVVFPFLLIVIIALIQHFSYEETQKRHEKKRLREQKKNAPAPKILGD